jgi:hypothetical protein
MHSEWLDLTHQIFLKNKFQLIQSQLSEYSFANLYLFRKLHQYKLIFAQNIYITGIDREGRSFLMLTDPPNESHLEELYTLLQPDTYLFPIQEEWLPLFPLHAFKFSCHSADTDYLFSVEKLAFYPGRHLSKKRNLVQQLLRQHDIESLKLDSVHKKDALKILNDWQIEHGQVETDYFSCQEAIELLEKLELEGILLYVDGIPAGFVIGEYLTSKCFVIHFAKANANIHGLYQYLYQYQSKLLLNVMDWINLEQDLGIPSLRQAKHSYLPDRMLHKYRINIKPA